MANHAAFFFPNWNHSMVSHAAYLFYQLNSQLESHASFFFPNWNHRMASHAAFFYFYSEHGKPYCVVVLPIEIRAWQAFLGFCFTNWNHSIANHAFFFFPKWNHRMGSHSAFLLYHKKSEHGKLFCVIDSQIKIKAWQANAVFLYYFQSEHWKLCCVFV